MIPFSDSQNILSAVVTSDLGAYSPTSTFSLIREFGSGPHAEGSLDIIKRFTVFLVNITFVFWYWYCRNDGLGTILSTGSVSSFE